MSTGDLNHGETKIGGLMAHFETPASGVDRESAAKYI